MSQIVALEARLRHARIARDQDRFDWLQEELSKIAISYYHPVDPMQEMLSCYARQVARDSGTDLSTGWIRAAEMLRNALPDPDDQLYGILIASEAWALELRYTLADMVVFLRRMREVSADVEDTIDAAQNASQLYEELINRAKDIDAMLDRELPDGEIVASDWTRDPNVVPNALDILDRIVDDYTKEAENVEKREVSFEEIEKLAEQSGTLLRACFRANEAGVDHEELAAFILAFAEWEEMLEDLARERSLAPGILAALVTVESDPRITEDVIAASGAGLVAAYLEFHPDCTLIAYLTNCLTAAEQDA